LFFQPRPAVPSYPKTAFSVGYREAAVLVHVRTPFGRGRHCCWMVVDDDTTLILGRELLGYPKKLARIDYEESAEGVRAGVTRRGKAVLTLAARRGLRQPHPEPVFDCRTFNIGGIGQMFMLQPVWMFRPRESLHNSYDAQVSIAIADSEKENAAVVEKVTDRVYLARGFALGSVAMIKTAAGLVIVDTTESRAAAEEILARFREVTDQPIRAIIYTHGHRDHTLGTPVFFEPGVEVIATRRAVEFLKAYREELGEFLDRSRACQSGRLAEEFALELPYKGTFRMFGFYRSAAAMERQAAAQRP
jgi:hypothetical protein